MIWVILDKEKVKAVYSPPVMGENVIWEGSAWDGADAIHKAFLSDPARIDPVTKKLRRASRKRPRGVPAGTYQTKPSGEGEYFSADGNVYKIYLSTAEVFASHEGVKIRII